MLHQTEGGCYDWFMDQAKRHPLLSADQEISLAHRIQAWLLLQQVLDEEKREPDAAEKRVINRGKRAYDRFFNCNLRLLGKLANKWKMAATHLSREDLVQEGALGLSRAILKFDPTLGYKFSTYAYWWIQQSMSRGLDNSDRLVRLPGACLTALKKVRNWQPGFVAEHGRMPTLEECAAHAEVTVANLKVYMRHIDVPVSLNAAARSSADKGEGADNLQFIASPHATPEETMVELAEREEFKETLKSLPADEMKIIDMLFGLSGEKPLTIHMTCQLTKLPKTRIANIRDKAINKMRAYACRNGIRL
jgi:RNA polymerase primary sigma factor